MEKICGIYKINIQNLSYIGQSINIASRVANHEYLLKNNIHYNSKMQLAYSIHKILEYDILCECSREELNKTEQEAIDIFDTVDNGLNILGSYSGNITKFGANHGNAKFTEATYIQIFEELVYTDNSIATIAKSAGVAINVVKDISAGKSHCQFFSTNYPIEYQKLLRNKRTNGIGKYVDAISPSIINKEGTILKIGNNVALFCKENNLDATNIARVISGERISHKGWKLYKG